MYSIYSQEDVEAWKGQGGTQALCLYNTEPVLLKDLPATNARIVGGSGKVCAYLSTRETLTADASSVTFDVWGSGVVVASAGTIHAHEDLTVHVVGYAPEVHAERNVLVRNFEAYGTITGSGTVVLGNRAANADGIPAIDWLAIYGITPDEEGVVTLYKGVNEHWTTDHGFDYSPGATPVAQDYSRDPICGGGLHFSPTPFHTGEYNHRISHYMACRVAVENIVVIGNKIKTDRVLEPGCVEVDVFGRPIAPSEDKLQDSASAA